MQPALRRVEGPRRPLELGDGVGRRGGCRVDRRHGPPTSRVPFSVARRHIRGSGRAVAPPRATITALSPSSSPDPRSCPATRRRPPGFRDQFDAGVVELEALGVRRDLSAGDGFHAERGHQQRELHRRRPDEAVLHVLDSRAPAVDRHDDGVAPGGVEGQPGAGGGRLVDRVDEVDVGVDGEQLLHRRPTAFLAATRDLVADDPRIVLVAPLIGVPDVDAEAGQESLVAQDVDRRLVLALVEHGDLRRLRIGNRGGGPLSDQLAGPEVVGGKGGVGGVDRVERRVEGDDHETSLPRLLDRGHDGDRVARGDHEPGSTGRDEVLDGGHLGVVVAVDSPANVRSSTPSSSAFAWAPSRILTKNGFDSVFVIRPMIAPSPDGSVVDSGGLARRRRGVGAGGGAGGGRPGRRRCGGGQPPRLRTRERVSIMRLLCCSPERRCGPVVVRFDNVVKEHRIDLTTLSTLGARRIEWSDARRCATSPAPPA